MVSRKPALSEAEGDLRLFFGTYEINLAVATLAGREQKLLRLHRRFFQRGDVELHHPHHGLHRRRMPQQLI